jgi:hypothetical protein
MPLEIGSADWTTPGTELSRAAALGDGDATSEQPATTKLSETARRATGVRIFGQGIGYGVDAVRNDDRVQIRP